MMNSERILQLLQIAKLTIEFPILKPIHDQAMSDLSDEIVRLTAPDPAKTRLGPPVPEPPKPVDPVRSAFEYGAPKR